MDGKPSARHPRSPEPIGDSPTDLAGCQDPALLIESLKEHALFLLDGRGRVASWNAGAERLLGHREEEILREHLGRLYAPEDTLRGKPDRHLACAAAEGRFEEEGWRIRKDGSRFRAHVTLVPLDGDAGRPRGFTVLVRDLTGRGRAEGQRAELVARRRASQAAAEENEQRYRTLAEAIPQIVWSSRPDGDLDYFNGRWFEATGLGLEESLGGGWQSALHPAERALWVTHWRRAVAMGDTFELECRLRYCVDGAYRWHLARAVPLSDGRGRIVRWFGTCTDVDAEKRIQQEAQFLAKASAALASPFDGDAALASVARLAVPRMADWCFVHLLEPDGSCRRLVAAHVDASRLELLLELEREYPSELPAPCGPSQSLRSGRPEVVTSIPELAPHGAVTSGRGGTPGSLGIRSYVSAPLRVRGRTLGTITFASAESDRRYGPADVPFAQDLADRAAVALDYARLYAQAQESNRLKDEFLSTLSHELRTPLTSILGWAGLLRSGQLDEASSARAFEIIERGAKLQTQLIEDLLDISRIVSGKLRLDVRPTELAPLIDAAVDAFRPAAEAKGVRLVSVLDAAVGPIAADADRLQQVVSNLVGNAIKFTPADGRVEVRLGRAESRVRIEVIDTGRGIAAEFLPYVFDRFRQAEGSSRRSHGGLGLGLSIVRHLVELHGGTVHAESPGEDRGATFTVELPLVRRGTAGVPQAAASAPGGGVELARLLEGVRVLLVDDEPSARELLAAVLGRCGALVTAVASAPAALEALAASGHDVLLSDIGMPGEDGYELIRKVRSREDELGGRIPAAALTAYASEDDRRRALSAGFQAHVVKPVEPSALADVVAALVRGGAGRGIGSSQHRPQSWGFRSSMP